MTDKITHGQCYLDDGMGGHVMKIDTQMVVFLCPNCPNVHFEIGLPALGMALRFVWFEKDAENLANQLLYPDPMPPDQLHIFKDPLP